MNMWRCILATVGLCALVSVGVVRGDDYNDYADGNWNNWQTWAETDTGWPGSGDTATLDDHKVTVNINLEGGDQPDEIILDGGEMFLYYHSRKVYGAISVKSDSTISGDTAVNKWTALIYAPISDKVIASVTHTGVLTKTDVGYVGVYADNMPFTGGWNVDAGRLTVGAGGGLGAGAVNVNSGGELMFSADHNAAQLPSAINVNAGGAVSMNADMPQETLIAVSGGAFIFPGGCVYPGSIEFSDGTTNTVTGQGAGSYTSCHLTGTITGSGSATVDFYRLYDAYHEFIELGGNNENFLCNIDFHGPGGYDVTNSNALGTNTPGAGTVTVHSDCRALALHADVARDVTLDGGVLSSGANCTYSGVLTLSADSTIAGIGANPRNFIITGTITEDAKAPRKLTFDMRGNNTKDRSYIELHNAANNWSGGSEINGYMYSQVKVMANGALGLGTVNVNGAILYTLPADPADSVLSSVPRVNVQGGTLKLKSNEAVAKALPGPIHIHEGGGLWIEAASTTPVWSGAEQNFQLHDGAILDNDTVLVSYAPDRSDIEGNGQVYKGLRAEFTGEESFGPHETALYKGLATICETDVTISGTMNENTAGQGFSLYTQNARYITFSNAVLNAAGTVTLRGEGNFNFSGTGNFTGTAGTIEMGSGGRVYFDSSGGLPAGKTLNVNDGAHLKVGQGDSLADGSAVNINDGGIFYVDKDLSSGSITVNSGGGVGVYTAGGLGTPTTFSWAGSNMHLLLGKDNISNLPTGGNVNFVLNTDGNDVFGEGIVLGEDTRLTGSAGTYVNTRLAATSGDLTATGTAARVCATDGTTLTLQNKVNLPGATLVIGDDEDFETIYWRNYYDPSGTHFGDATQGGTVYLANHDKDDVIGAIDVEGGTLQVHAQGYIGGAAWIRFAEGTSFYSNYDFLTESITLMGSCTMTGGRSLGLTGKRAGDDPEGEHLGTLSPGGAPGEIGTFSIPEDHFYFQRTGYEVPEKATEYENVRYVVDVVGACGESGVDYDHVSCGLTVYRLYALDVEVNLPVPDGEINPDALAGVEMAIITAGAFNGAPVGGAFIGAGTDPHWVLTHTPEDPAVEVMDNPVAGKDLILHGSALSWTGFGGDADLNGVVNYLDLGVLATYYDQTGMGWDDGDFTFDGKVDYMDLGILATNYDLTEGSGGAPVPEPAFAILLGAGVVGLLRRRRR